MTAQQTPGPYIIQPALNRRHVFIISEITGEPVAQVYRQSDAPLLAAAPLLLASVTFAVARIELANNEGNSILSAWLPDARVAIADATKEGEIGAHFASPNVRAVARETLAALKQAAAALAICANHATDEQKKTILSWFNAARAQIRKAEIASL
jgi:hypothetical protein